MKKQLMIAAMIAAALPIGAQQQAKYSVKGTGDYEGKTVYIVDQLNGARIDSATVKNGEVTLSGNSEQNSLLGLQLRGDVWQTIFFNDGTPVTVDLKRHTLTGSPTNEKLSRYSLEMDVLMKLMTQMNDEYRQLSQEEKEAKLTDFQGRAVKIYEDIEALCKRIVENNQDNLIPAAFVTTMVQVMEEPDFNAAFDAKYGYTKHPLVAKVKQQIANQNAAEQAKRAIIGQQFKDLEEQDIDGNTHKLSEYVGKGNWVLVDFWASWCGPCRAEMPNVVAAYEKYVTKGFNIVGLSFDNKKGPWVKAIADLKMPWTHLSDLKGWKTVAAEVYGVNSIPDNLLIDPSGKIVARGLRAEALHAKLQEIFGE